MNKRLSVRVTADTRGIDKIVVHKIIAADLGIKKDLPESRPENVHGSRETNP